MKSGPMNGTPARALAVDIFVLIRPLGYPRLLSRVPSSRASSRTQLVPSPLTPAALSLAPPSIRIRLQKKSDALARRLPGVIVSALDPSPPGLFPPTVFFPLGSLSGTFAA